MLGSPPWRGEPRDGSSAKKTKRGGGQREKKESGARAQHPALQPEERTTAKLGGRKKGRQSADHTGDGRRSVARARPGNGRFYTGGSQCDESGEADSQSRELRLRMDVGLISLVLLAVVSVAAVAVAASTTARSDIPNAFTSLLFPEALATVSLCVYAFSPPFRSRRRTYMHPSRSWTRDRPLFPSLLYLAFTRVN